MKNIILDIEILILKNLSQRKISKLGCEKWLWNTR